nr:AmmeMemoRadiSam system protein B [Oscillatoria sp. Prado101]
GLVDRQPAVAGQFYASSPTQLKADLSVLFSKAVPPAGKAVVALISPHAGYVFSGEVAASSFNQLDPEKIYDNIFILASSHRMSFDGASIYTKGNYETPLGEVKVKEAQKHLDGLPVWFLGYQPQVYCSLFGCSWRFTLDEFQAARKDVGRMEAKVFQEKNAQTQLRGAEEAFLAAKQQYEGAKPGAEQQKAIAAWQAALDRMKEIAPATLAEKMARTKLQAAGRDFQEVVGDAAGRTRTNTLIEAAKTFAMAAAESSQNPPHTPEEWEQIAGLWEKAINQLNKVPLEDAGYIDAQKKLAEYTKNKGVAETRKKTESESAGALNRAKRLIAEWQRLAGASNPDRGNLARQLQEIINELETVRAGTTAYSEAKDMLKFARDTLKNLPST